MNVGEVIGWIEETAPVALQESYDNAGLLVGDRAMPVSGVLISLDITEEVIEEAILHNCNLIISHHPLIFKGLKKLTGQNYVQRCVIKAVKNDVAIYAAHTNIDNVLKGVNGKIADIIGLTNRSILSPKNDSLVKLVTFVPKAELEAVRDALFTAGAGSIGNYDSCSFNTAGTGTFRANEQANPFVGGIGNLHNEQEIRLEVILPAYLTRSATAALYRSHPYEEPAFDIIPLLNSWNSVGAGIVGELEQEMDELDFLQKIKEIFAVDVVRHTNLLGKKIKRVAVCGGSGSSFLGNAKAHKADVFISGDFKYHEFFDAEDQILIADIGHYESEQYTKEVFYEIITKKIANFAVRISEVKTNPINYL